MTPQEYQQAIQGVISDIEGGAVTDLMVQLATDTLATIRQRVQQTGIDSNGAKYRDYTEGYKKFKMGLTADKKTGRRYPNRYKGYTDFSLTNDMWNSMQVVKVNDNMAAIMATGSDKTGISNRDKLQRNTDKFGPINEASQDERKQIVADYKTGVLNIFARHGLMPKG